MTRDASSDSDSGSDPEGDRTNPGRPDAPGGFLGPLALGAWATFVVLALLLAGPYLGQLIEGVDFSLMTKVPLALMAGSALAAMVCTVLWARAPSPDGTAASGRRRFLAGGAGIVGGLAAGGAAAFARIAGWATTTGPSIGVGTPVAAPSVRPEWSGARVNDYRTLGRTGFAVSDISLGSSKIRGEVGEKVARLAIERGVNYFDTAPDYSEAGSELALGRAMKGHRDKMFLATKFCTPHGHLPEGSRPEDYIAAVEGSLGRLQTDYVDLVHIHACDSLGRLLDPNVHEAFERLKEQGKARFLGFSSHTPKLESVADAALADGRFDVMMLAYHHGAWPRLGEIARRAAEQGVGVVAMKTLKGARHRGLLEDRDESDSYTQAAFKWVLANPDVSCLVISFRELANVDEYLYASGRRPGAADLALLEKYDRAIEGKHCYPHCGACLDSCPHGVPIDDVLRHRMYFESYGEQKEAMRLYARLERDASVCASCPAPCAAACPHGVPIPEATREAHDLLRSVV
ncbi:MAG: aldo/keto reductase [Myxococcota bacterium]